MQFNHDGGLGNETKEQRQKIKDKRSKTKDHRAKNQEPRGKTKDQRTKTKERNSVTTIGHNSIKDTKIIEHNRQI